MEKIKYTIEVPDEVIQTLHVKKGDQVHLKVANKTLYLEKDAADKQAISFNWIFIPTMIAAVLFFAYFMYRQQSQIQLIGAFSIATMIIILGLVSGMCSFTFFFIKAKKNIATSQAKAIYWRDFPTIVLAFTLILAMCLLVLFYGVGKMFAGASFDIYTATFIFSLFTCMINYFMTYAALSLSPSMITKVLSSVVISGVGVSMIMNSKRQWWHYNFSFLGTEQAANSWQFNVTLVFSALLFIALIDYLFVLLSKRYPNDRRIFILKWLLVGVALNLGAIGLFPNNGHGQLHHFHDKAANFLVFMVLLLIVGIRWILPNVSEQFLLISYGMGFFLYLSDILFKKVHYLSLTAFELIAFILAFIWILLLIQRIERLSSESMEQSFSVMIE